MDEAVAAKAHRNAQAHVAQLLVLDDASCRSNITVQIVPAEIGAHAGMLGAFIVAGVDNETGYV